MKNTDKKLYQSWGLEFQIKVYCTDINVTDLSVQLFDKLKIQQSSAGDELAKKPKEDQETATKHQPAHSTSKGGHSRTESKLSDAGKTKQDKHKVSLKDQSPEVCQKKDSQMYGKVRVRHINQLFIRGENVILVNPQPLWFLFSDI